jgi:NMD protein affecting ribosome stability and mRNA decay
MAYGECPVCGNDSHICPPESALRVYDTGTWRGKTGLLKVPSAETVCAWCKAIKIDGDWTRIQSVDSRADELSRTGNKSKQEYRETLTAGDTRA